MFCIGFLIYFRWKSGVASSLNYIHIDSKDLSPILIPYPSWKANTIESDGTGASENVKGRADAKKAEVVNGPLADNSSIISTFRIRVDECDRLWVMDSGLADILGNPKQIAPPALVIFDLNTNKLIRRFIIPSSQIKSDTFFANVVSSSGPLGTFQHINLRTFSYENGIQSIFFCFLSFSFKIVDVPKNGCDDAFAYVPDLGAYATVVYSFKTDKSWRVKHNFFYFDPM